MGLVVWLCGGNEFRGCLNVIEFLIITLGFIVIIILLAISPEIEDDSSGGFMNLDGKWRDAFKNPTKIQIFVWGFAILFFVILCFLIIKWNAV